MLYDAGVLLMRGDRDKSAQECFSALQLIESNPVIWASLGCIYERDAEAISDKKYNSFGEKDDGNDEDEEGEEDPSGPHKTHPLTSANDSFIASIEIAKPTEALLGTALTWIKTHSKLFKSTLKKNRGVEHEQTLIGIHPQCSPFVFSSIFFF